MSKELQIYTRRSKGVKTLIWVNFIVIITSLGWFVIFRDNNIPLWLDFCIVGLSGVGAVLFEILFRIENSIRNLRKREQQTSSRRAGVKGKRAP